MKDFCLKEHMNLQENRRFESSWWFREYSLNSICKVGVYAKRSLC
jgi:hypothetical protein